MYKVIIVDDEMLAVEGVKCAINWEKLRVSSVFTAYNIRQAKEVFEKENIDVLLCDIEMPQGNGIEMLTWVRQNYPKTEVIFLTCHADFSYAKQALKLGSFDYILKPIPFEELEGVIAKAIDKIDVERKLIKYSKMGEKLYKSQPLLVESFWEEVLNQTISPKLEAIKEAAEDRNVAFKEGETYLPILISIQRWHKELNAHEEKVMEYALKTVAMERIIETPDNGQVIVLREGVFVGILNMSNYKEHKLMSLEDKCKIYIAMCNEYLYCDLCCYIGTPIKIQETESMVSELSTLDKNNVAYNNKVYFLKRNSVKLALINMPDMSLWAVMLGEGDKSKVIYEACKFIEGLVDKNEIDANGLYNFQQDFLQMVYTVLKQKGIQAHKLLNEKKDIEMHAQASRNVVNLTKWLTHIVEKSIDYIWRIKESESVVDKVKKYIRDNINQELHREEIANQVYLNADYLNRIFKKETGVSISEYIMQERFNIAQKLLLNTDMTISTIAAQVGYTNFSHFSKMFKKYNDMNPLDFRKKHFKRV